MSINFFSAACSEAPRKDTRFGICDDQDSTKAYTDTANSDKWIAVVRNENSEEVIFTAIDNCTSVLKAGTNQRESTCDGMLTFRNRLYLVELKDQNQRTRRWIDEALGQLENTIKLIAENQLSAFGHKKA